MVTGVIFFRCFSGTCRESCEHSGGGRPPVIDFPVSNAKCTCLRAHGLAVWKSNAFEYPPSLPAFDVAWFQRRPGRTAISRACTVHIVYSFCGANGVMLVQGDKGVHTPIPVVAYVCANSTFRILPLPPPLLPRRFPPVTGVLLHAAAVKGHHVATLLVLMDPLVQRQHAFYTACALLVEFNTVLLILRRRVVWGRYLEVPFALSWVALRLIW